jgi:hypothetical protein
MAAESFAFSYVVSSGSVGGTLTLLGPFGNTADISEQDTNPNDGTVAVGDDVFWDGGTFKVLGITSDGDPIIQPDGGGLIRVLSDNGALSSVGSSVSAYALCFLAGTEISTPVGRRAVEALEIGDRILTTSGGTVPVKWIGRQTVSTRFGPAERLMPVRFAAGSLGDGLPHTDLTVTADHGMLVDGVICHAGALVNGITIRRVPLAEMGDSYTVYHVETEAHEIILANGAPAETFIDNVSRRAFDNFAEFEALYGDVPEMEELPFPRAMSARQVPQGIFMRLSQRDVA